MKTKVDVAARSEKKNAKTKAKKSPNAKKKTASKKAQVLSDAKVAELILEHRDNGRKLARSILRRWRVRMPAEEIDSIVDLALCEAARRYCPDKGAAFMTFLFYHLRGHLVRSVAKAAQATNVFLAYGEKKDEEEEKEWQHVSSEPLWSFAPEHLLFGQRDAETPENVVLRQEKIDQCRDAVTKLDDLEKEIITRSFGSEQPLVDIAKNLGYSRCHISRVKKSALTRLKGILAESRDDGSEESKALVKEILAERNAVGRGRPRRRSRRRNLNESRRESKSLAA